MRLFLALEPPKEVKSELELALYRLKRLRHSQINWVKPDNLHLTINFIGDTPEELLSELWQAIYDELKEHNAFLIRPMGLQLFPDKSPRIIWLKLFEKEERLAALSLGLAKKMRQMGLDIDKKKLKLHVTLGRMKSLQSMDFERSVLSYPISEKELSWDTITLYKSILRPEGPKYQALERFVLP